jgi:HK97 family phage major capsid protein
MGDRLPDGSQLAGFRITDEGWDRTGTRSSAASSNVSVPRAPNLSEIAAFHVGAYQTLTGERRAGMPELYGDPIHGSTAGEVFTRSSSYQGWIDRFPAGGPAAPGNFWADPVHVGGGFRTLLTSSDASAGSLVANQHFGLLDPGLYRRATILQLLTLLPTTSDIVEYATETSHVTAAAAVSEATALTGTSGVKPEGGVTFALVSANVRTFAIWTPATKRIMSDADSLRRHIDGYSIAELERVVEDQVVAGNGSGENFLGILNTAGVQTQAAPGGGESNLDVIRKAVTKVQLNGRTTPNAAILHPNDSEQLALLKKNAEVNNFVGDPFTDEVRPIWGLRQVVTDAMPENTCLVGDFRWATLWDRESSTISVGTVNDDFIRNIVRVLAEARAAFGVVRAKAFCIVTLN